jgi:hypothetical protein
LHPIPVVTKKHLNAFIFPQVFQWEGEENQVKIARKPLSNIEMKVFGRFTVAQTHFCLESIFHFWLSLEYTNIPVNINMTITISKT